VSVGVDFEASASQGLQGAALSAQRFARTQEFSEQILAAIRRTDIQEAVNRLLALADEFPLPDHAAAVRVSYRLKALNESKNVISPDQWEESRHRLIALLLETLAEYQSIADVGRLAASQTEATLGTETKGLQFPVSKPQTTLPALVACDALGWNPDDRWALRGVSLNLFPGTIVGVVGLNGAGKTPLLRLLAEVLLPSEGHVSFPAWEGSGLARRAIRGHVAYVAQMPVPYRGGLTPNLRRCAALYGLQGQALQEEVAFVTERFGLSSYRDASSLSVCSTLLRSAS
jgi:ABC-type multidrug transport system fused ATPase/permease subunit